MARKFRLAVILFLAVGLRLVNLDQSLWLDEAIQVWAVKTYTFTQLLKEYFPTDFNPPLSYLLSWLAVFFMGTSEVALRLPSVVFGVANVLLVYYWAKKILPQRIVLPTLGLNFPELAALLLAIAPLHIYYSQEARAYILACFLATWSMFEFWLLLCEKNKSTWRYILATILLLYSHYLAWFLLPVQGLYLLLAKSQIILRRLISAWIIIFLAVLPWLPMINTQFKGGQAISQELPAWQELGSFSLKNVVLIPLKFILGRISIENQAVYAVLTVLLFIFVGTIFYKTVRNIKQPVIQFLWLWLVVPLILGITVSFFTPIMQYFRFLFLLPAFYLLLIFGLVGLRKKTLSYLATGLIILNFIASGVYLVNDKFHREDWKKAVSFIHERNPSAKVVILKPVQAPFWFYDQSKSRFIDYQGIEKVRYEKNLWLVKYAQPIFDPENIIEKSLLDYGFVEVSQNHFRGVTIKYYVNPSGLTA